MKTYFDNHGLVRFRNLRVLLGEGDGEGEGASFTQEQVNTMLAEDRRKNETKFKKQMKDTTAQLEAMKTEGMSDDEREAHQTQIKTLKTQWQTKVQQEREETERVAGEAKTAQEALTGERDAWKSRFEESTISNQLTRASTDPSVKAANPDLITQILRPQTSMRPITNDDGEQTGQFEAVVSFASKDKEGKLQTLEVTPAEAIAKMKEDTAQFGSLFASTQKGGVGTQTPGAPEGGGSIDVTSQEAYREARKAGKTRTIGA